MSEKWQKFLNVISLPYNLNNSYMVGFPMLKFFLWTYSGVGINLWGHERKKMKFPFQKVQRLKYQW